MVRVVAAHLASRATCEPSDSPGFCATVAQYHNAIQAYKPGLTPASVSATDPGGLRKNAFRTLLPSL